MAYRDILVHLDDDPRATARLDLALALAGPVGAHVTGVSVINVPAVSMFYGYSMTVASPGPDDFIRAMRAEALGRLGAVEAAFRAKTRAAGIEGTWRVSEGEPGQTLALQARYADLAIVGQPNRHEPRGDGSDHIPVSVLMGSGRPALVVPFAGDFAMPPKHVLLAWNATREAARALHDALPLLAVSGQVTVLEINAETAEGGMPAQPAGDIVAHMARHGVKATSARTVATDIAAGEALLSYAADIGAGLIVAGGYGHSRIHELAFGGVTRTLLNEMTVPVFFSH